jgi:hypothetical protein
MTPIERLAETFQATWDDGSEASVNLPPIDFTDAETMHFARALLTELRSMASDTDIVEAGFRAREYGMTMEQSAVATFTAMIDHILNEGGGDGSTT